MALLIVNLLILGGYFLYNNFFGFTPLNFTFLIKFVMILLFANIIASVCFSFMYCDKKTNKKEKTNFYIRTGICATIGFLLVVVGTFVTTSKMFNHEKYRALAGEVQTHDFTKDIETVDLKKLPIINEELAKNLADKKLGEIPSLGSTATVGDLTLQRVNDDLYYVGPIEHTGFFKWHKNKTTPGYIKVNATKENDVELITEVNGEKLNLKYLGSSYFGSNIERYAYKNYKKNGLTDFSFEIDDEGKPYWVISIYEKTIGISGNKAIGTLIIDSQTGETKEYSIEETPSWVDRIQPKIIMQENLENWGELVKGVFNFSKTDMLTLTDGMSVLYNGDDCYYYTGVTSVGGDESLVGFFLTNTRTGETTMFKTSGATESAAISSAEGMVQAEGYKGTFPVLINIQNEPTYFLTLLDNKGLIKKYAFVNVKNYNTVAVGDTIKQAHSKYVSSLGRDTSSNLDANTEIKELEGVVNKIGMFINNGATYYMLKVDKLDIKFVVPTDIATEVCIVEKGDKVKLTYIPNETKDITVNSFEILE